METSSWLIQIYAVTDEISQELIAGLLAGVEDLTVEATSEGSRRLVVVECSDPMQAPWVSQLVKAIDFGARLEHVATAPQPAPVKVVA